MPTPQPHIVHVDMDAFFVSLELVRNPALRGRPLIVGGGDDGQGVVTSASYEARPYGITAGMPLFQALRRCPQAIVLPVDFHYYHEAAKKVFATFRTFTPDVEVCSIDEAYLDLSGTQSLWGSPLTTARKIKEAVYQATNGATCSVGLADSCIVSKIAGGLHKPNALVCVRDSLRFLGPLPVALVPGIGRASIPKLHNLGLRSIWQIRRFSRRRLQELFGASYGGWLHEVAWGQDSDQVIAQRPIAKSMSHAVTLRLPTNDYNYLVGILSLFSDRLVAQLRRDHLFARTATLTIRLDNLQFFSKHQRLAAPQDTYTGLFPIVRQLFDTYRPREPHKVRLIGIGFANLTPLAPQPTLFNYQEGNWEESLANSIFQARKKFGGTAIQWGAAFASPRLRAKQDHRTHATPHAHYAPFQAPPI